MTYDLGTPKHTPNTEISFLILSTTKNITTRSSVHHPQLPYLVRRSWIQKIKTRSKLIRDPDRSSSGPGPRPQNPLLNHFQLTT